MSHFTIVAITLLFFASVPVSASDPALDLGGHLFALGDYDTAITEYKRFLFFNADHPQAVDAQFKIGLAYRAQEWWAEAVEAMIAAIELTTVTELQAEMRVELAVTLIASGAYDLALIELIKVDMQSQSARLRQRARFLRGVAYLYQFKWEQARSVFQVYFDEIPSAAGAAAEIDALFLDALNRSQKSEKAARLLSTFLPGLGQTYAGDWKNGLNALLLNGVLGYITLDAAIERDYDDALLSFFFLFYRYYAGNRYRAVEAAQTFNDWENRRHVEKILQALATQFAEGKRKE
jgi:tetratricopeptide (TPR) repeat protein